MAGNRIPLRLFICRDVKDYLPWLADLRDTEALWPATRESITIKSLEGTGEVIVTRAPWKWNWSVSCHVGHSVFRTKAQSIVGMEKKYTDPTTSSVYFFQSVPPIGQAPAQEPKCAFWDGEVPGLRVGPKGWEMVVGVPSGK